MKGLITFDGVLPNVIPLTDQVDIPLVIVTKLTDFVDGTDQQPRESGLKEGWHHYSEVLDACTNDVRPRPNHSILTPQLSSLLRHYRGSQRSNPLSRQSGSGIHECAMWGDCLINDIAIERRTPSASSLFHIYGEICR